MANEVYFYFHGSLNDFLLPSQRGRWIMYSCKITSTTKDSIEAIGVPHVEVKTIKSNGSEITFTDLVHLNEKIEVFPYETPDDYIAAAQKNNFPAISFTFVLDVHAGKLAKHLRLLGFDVLYNHDYDDNDIAHISQTQNRIVLTRDVGLLKQKIITYGYWLRSHDSHEQLLEVVNRFGLKDKINPFTRCLVCNGILQVVDKQYINHLIPPKTTLYFNEFFQCQNCEKVYWKGSHYTHMKTLINRIIP